MHCHWVVCQCRENSKLRLSGRGEWMINSKGNREFEMQNSEFKIRNVADIETLSLLESPKRENLLMR